MSPADRGAARVAAAIAELYERMSRLERAPRLRRASIEGEPLHVFDPDGTLRQTLGAQPDGTYTVIDFNGPPPPVPSTPVVTARPGVLVVAWDGLWADPAAVTPLDFDHVEVHVGTSPGFVPNEVSELATLNSGRGESVTLALDEIAYYVKLQSVSTSGTESGPSVEVAATPLPAVVEGGVQHFKEPEPPSGLTADDAGAVWFDTNDGDHPYVWDGTRWVDLVGPAGATGSQGIPGPPGADGQTLYTWLKYADTPTTGMSDDPTGKTYMGIAYNKTSSTESTAYADYQWSLIQGPEGDPGVPGPPGADGQPTYTWIKYGTSSTGADLSDSPTGKTHIGIAYNKTTNVESTNPADYEWSLIQGPAGAPAATVALTATAQVLAVPAAGGATTPASSTVTGTAANTTITVWQYSVDGAAFTDTVPAGVSRTGNVVTITGSTMTARTIAVRAADAGGVADTLTVAKVSDGATGSTGASGPAGADAYTVLLTNESHTFPGSTSAALAGSTTSQVLAYKGTAQQAATIGTITGQVSGLTTAVTNNGTTTAGFTVTVTTALTAQSGELVVPVTVDGVAFTKRFSWSVSRQGAQGVAGPEIALTATAQILTAPASGGATTPATSTVTGTGYNTTISVWEYSVDGGAFSATVPAGASRSGNVVTITGGTMTARTIAVRMADANGVADTLTVAKALDGATGPAGSTGPAGVGVTGTTVTYQVGSSGTTAPTGTWQSSPQPTSPGQYLWTRTVTSYSDTSTSTAYSVAAHGSTGSTGATGVGVTGTTVTYQVGTSGTTAPTGTWQSSPQATSPGQYLWTRTVTTYSDASTTTAYAVAAHGTTGAAGADAYTVLLTNEAHTFAGGTSAAVAGSTTSAVLAYKGTAQQAATIGTITGQVTGLTTSIQNNGTTTAGFTVTVTTSLTATSGTLTVPVTVDGRTFNKTFSWTVTRTGATGATGPAGVTWRGSWAAGTAYAVNDAVTYLDPATNTTSSYRRLVAGTTTGNPKADTGNWQLFAGTPPPDGLAPSTAPKPEALGGIGWFILRWEPTANPTPVTYEVHVSEIAGFTPAPATLLAETQDLQLLARAMPDGSAFLYPQEQRRTRRNLIPNPSAETDTAFWLNSANATLARSTAQAYPDGGVASLSMTSTAAGDMRARTVTTSIPVYTRSYGAVDTTVLRYGAGVWLRSAAVARSARVSLVFYAADGVTQVGTTVAGANVTTSTSGWTRATVDATGPTDAAYVSAMVTIVGAAGANEVHYADAGLLEPLDGYHSTELGDYFDGSTVAVTTDVGTAHAWTGTAHASASTATSPEWVTVPKPYYFRIVTKDVDAVGPAGLESSAQAVRAAGPDIAVNAVTANQLAARAVIAEHLATNIILSSTIYAPATTGRRVEISQGGISLWDVLEDGTAYKAVDLPTTGAPAEFKGKVVANEISILNGATLRSTANELARASTLTLSQGTTAPSAAPRVDVGYDYLRLGGDIGSFSSSTVDEYHGLARGPDGNWWVGHTEVHGTHNDDHVYVYSATTGSLLGTPVSKTSTLGLRGMTIGKNTAISTTPTNFTGTTTSGDRSVTAAAGTFTAQDEGATVTGTGIPANAYVTMYVSSSQVYISVAATASGTVTLTKTRTQHRLYVLSEDVEGSSAIWELDVYAIPTVPTTAPDEVMLIDRKDLYTNRASSYWPCLGWDWDNNRLLMADPNSANGLLSIRALTFDASDNHTTTTWTSSDTYNQDLAFVARTAYDYGVSRYLAMGLEVASGWQFRVYSTTTNTGVIPNEQWPQVENVPFRGAWYDGNAAATADRTVYTLGSDLTVYRHERDGNSWVGTSTDTTLSKWWAGLTYRDEQTAVHPDHAAEPGGCTHNAVGLPAGTHETSLGTVSSFTMKKRARVVLSTDPPPNYNLSGDVGYNDDDDPLAYGFFLGRGSATPARTAMWRQGYPGPSVYSLAVRSAAFAAATNVTNPPDPAASTTGFPNTTPAKVQAFSGGFWFDALSNGSIGTKSFATSVRTAASEEARDYKQPGVVAWKTAAFSRTPGQNTSLGWDDVNLYNGFTVSGNGFVIPISGWYVIQATVSGSWDSWPAWVELFQGATLIDGPQMGDNQAGNRAIVAGTVARVAAGVVITVNLGLHASATTGFTGQWGRPNTNVEIVRVGGY